VINGSVKEIFLTIHLIFLDFVRLVIDITINFSIRFTFNIDLSFVTRKKKMKSYMVYINKKRKEKS